jgi:chromosome segregation ATPase
MAAKETTLNELGEMLGHVVEHMATKEDIASLRTELKGDIAKLDARVVKLDERVAAIERELSSIRRDLDELAAKVENVIGYRKEIDHALERIAAIEKHLGIGRLPTA